MTFDTSPLERDCVLLNCSSPAVAPLQGKVHCAKHDPNPTPLAPVPVAEEPVPETPAPTARPALPDMATMEPVWDGTQFVLRPRHAGSVQIAREDLQQLLENLSAAITLIEKWLA